MLVFSVEAIERTRGEGKGEKSKESKGQPCPLQRNFHPLSKQLNVRPEDHPG